MRKKNKTNIDMQEAPKRMWSIDPDSGELCVDIPSVAEKCSVFIATPTYGRVTAQYTSSLARTVLYLTNCKIKNEWSFHMGCSVIDLARNMMVADFLKSKMTHMLFIDDDLDWDHRAVVRMLAMDLPIYGGTYSKKGMDDMAHVACGNGKRMFGCTEAWSLPTGFMLIKREVIEDMIQKRPDLKFKFFGDDETDKYTYRFFQSTIHPVTGEWLGEDYFFCELAKSLGYEVWVDMIHKIEHIGSVAFKHNIAKRVKFK